MPSELHAFDVFPKIVRAGSQQTITIAPRYALAHFEENVTYEVTFSPMEEIGFESSTFPIRRQIQPEEGALRVPADFPGEQEYRLRILPAAAEPKTRPIDLRLYALEEDLFTRRPFKGDFHLHSLRSDGRETPAYVAGACRRIGLDFMAVTDHHRYAPSLEAIHAFEDAPIDLLIYPGEEVHPPNTRVHMINFGGQFSVNDLFTEAAYPAGVAALEAELADLPAGPLRAQYAACLWTYQKIRQAGGLAVFCHPYWVTQQRYNVPEALIARHLAPGPQPIPWDAFELIGGYHRYEFESNLLQVARYHEARACGQRIPIVGASDSHGCETGSLFGWYYSIVFAASAGLPELIASVKDCCAVAVEALPNETARAHGPFRLVKYAQYLLREVLPQHDALCFEEGRLMLAYLAGDPRALAGLQARRGQTAALYDHLWGTA